MVEHQRAPASRASQRLIAASTGILVAIASAPLLASCAAEQQGTPSDSGDEAAPSCLGKCDAHGDDVRLRDYEFIVVGSGAGGGPLAANLARAGHDVLLLEAGGDMGGSLEYQVPAFHPHSTEHESMRWDYYVDHYADTDRAMRDSKMVYREPDGELFSPAERGIPSEGWTPGSWADRAPDGAEPMGVLYPRAGTLGGCTAHNAMITVYPHESDWNRLWQRTGDLSWRSEHMRHYLGLLERNRYVDRGEALETGHGVDGWLQTELADPRMGLGDTTLRRTVLGAAIAFGEDESWFPAVRTAEELKRVVKGDLNAARDGRDVGEGMYNIPLATSHGRRDSPREYLLDTIEQGYPLTVRLHSLVTNVVFEDPVEGAEPRAVGVDFLAGSRLYGADPNAREDADVPQRRATVRDGGEVVLSAGSFNTPQLLMLSGIGPRDELERVGIDVRVDAPGVGANLQDRYEVGVVAEFRRDGEPAPLETLSECAFDPDAGDDDPCLRQWQRGEGPYTSNGGVVSMIQGSSTAGADPDLFMFGLPGSFRGYYPEYSREAVRDTWHFTWAILKGHTANRAGTVRLRSADPTDTPDIDFNSFAEGGDEDLRAIADGVQLVRHAIDEADTLLESLPETGDGRFGSAEVSMREVWPGPDVEGAELEQFIRNESWGHHACCTAMIGADDDPMAVLDSEFRVRGTDNLRVVDASVFPRIPGFFIVLPIYMASENATNAILSDHGHDRWDVYVSHASISPTRPDGGLWDRLSDPDPYVELDVGPSGRGSTATADPSRGTNPDWGMARTLTDVSTEELRTMTVRMWDDDLTDELMCETTLEGRHLTGRSHTIACRRDGHEVYELHLLAEPHRQPVGR